MLKLYKMHGIGNKFIIYDLRQQENIKIPSELDKNLDYDQKIILLNSKKADILMKIYNADGSEASACGNATRCVASIIAKETRKDNITIETPNRILQVKKITDTKYQVNMGKPLLSWDKIAVIKDCDTQNLALLTDPKFTKGFALNIGNPHLVFFVDDIDNISLKEEVSFLENHPLFKYGVNINIAQIISKNEIKLKTWERGAGETLSCGTGACATGYVAYHKKLTNNNITISMPGGTLDIKISNNNEIYMSGETELEYYYEF